MSLFNFTRFQNRRIQNNNFLRGGNHSISNYIYFKELIGLREGQTRRLTIITPSVEYATKEYSKADELSLNSVNTLFYIYKSKYLVNY